MNRRNFIKSAAVTAIAFPTIVSAMPTKRIIQPLPIEPDRIRVQGNYLDILSVEELQSHGIRAAFYSAGCVDSKGVFCGEKGYCDKHMEPFVRFTHVIHGPMPHLWYYPEKDVKRVIQYYRDGKEATNPNSGEVHSLENLIADIKRNMEYVCFVAYCHFPAVPEEAWPEKWMPVVGGMSKHRYNRVVKSMNDPRDPMVCDCATCRCKGLS